MNNRKNIDITEGTLDSPKDFSTIEEVREAVEHTLTSHGKIVEDHDMEYLESLYECYGTGGCTQQVFGDEIWEYVKDSWIDWDRINNCDHKSTTSTHLGYIYQQPQVELVTVTCKNCKHSWEEEVEL